MFGQEDLCWRIRKDIDLHLAKGSTLYSAVYTVTFHGFEFCG